MASGPREWKNDVFVSFRGKEIRNGFMSHLFHAFEKANILCYRDTDGDQRGHTVGPMLKDAIKNSRNALIVFSPNYAESHWCLDEVVEIMNCAREYQGHGYMVVPIFFDVEPTDVKNQTADFGEGFRRCLAKEGHAKAAVWKAALEEAGNKSGLHLWNDANGVESELVEKIVGLILRQTSFRNSAHFISSAVGFDSKASDVISMLDIGNKNVQITGLFGIKGIGKTTLAKLVCSRVFSEFEGVSFLGNIGDAKHRSLVDFQKALMNDVNVKILTMYEHNPNQNIDQIRNKLSQKKILIVLDDVRDKNQVDLLGGLKGTLGNGSRILVTTEHEQLLDLVKVDRKYIVSGLSQNDSLQLFRECAFGGYPEEGYQELSKNLVHFTGGLPLAVITLGTCLSGRRKDQWHLLLEKLGENPNLDWIKAYSDYVNPPQFMVGTYRSPGAVSYAGKLDLFPLPCQFKVGPCGGLAGCDYDDKSFTGVRQIRIVVVGSIVESICVDYDQNGSLVRSGRHGGPRGGKVYKVMFDYPDEFLTSISGNIGYTNLRVIRSISIHSNKRKYGPFGEEDGTPFSIPEEQIEGGGKILGFFGKCGTSLDSIGVYYGSVSNPYPFETIGPFGHSEGNSWDDGKHSDVRQVIVVVFNSDIKSISIIYDNYGHPLFPFKHGGDGCEGITHSIKLDYPHEYLTSISGYMREDKGKLILHALSFHSNKRVYGPFGEETGIPFSGPSSGGKIVGFFGSSNSRLWSLGAYMDPVSHMHPVRRAGPFGGFGGGKWDDGVSNGSLREIVIYSGTVIDSIQCIYDSEGELVKQPRHGGGGGGKAVVELEYPDEYLTNISGYYTKRGTLTIITSLTFQSNKRVHGPYGRKGETYFQSPHNIGKLVGLYGRSGTYLDSIGAYFAPVFHIDPIKIAGPYGCEDGNMWDDGKHANLRRIILSFGRVIDGICCWYEDDDQPVTATHHGGHGGDSCTIVLDEDEYLISVSGYAGIYRGMTVIKSLTFGSNKAKKYGPYGTKGETPFSFSTSIGKIVGFSGRSARYLHAISAHVEILLRN
ncbi:hypothetical protein SAY86_017241 [Trapa natans]|uniref:Uncharacterized protein n=1 Tax=Trapa natans TaxID=22666 RepID=A0AAN7M175_TRANT|nr:hypothetical protein SAY86_017241 [Trapa natans]